MDKKLADLTNVRWKETRKVEMMLKRGEDDPLLDAREI
jgi:hypothetical protein